MIRKIFIFIAAAAMIVLTAEAEETGNYSLPEEIYDVETLCRNFSGLAGEEVFVKGTVDHVCRHSGMRMNLCQDDSFSVHVTASEGMDPFNQELTGKEVTVFGVVKQLIIDREYLSDWEKGLEEDCDSGPHHDEVEQIERYRAYLDSAGLDRLSEFWIEAKEIRE
ncbi:hypothetical protein JXL83_00615 [candidate division WOR-3 bacterium]|nr:hypothetical protein [candidate division WOR-3 bacterium]